MGQKISPNAIEGHVLLGPLSSSFACKFCNSPPSCVDPCKGQIYYVVHKQQSILRVAIHLGVHLHLVANGRCREAMDENKKLIEKEVNRMPNAKISTISLITSKSFLTKHLFNDNNDNNCEVFKGHQLEENQDKFIVLSLLNVCNLVASFKHRPGGGYIDHIVELKSKSCYDFI